jgi:flagellar basal-body rod modification protein FlgD
MTTVPSVTSTPPSASVTKAAGASVDYNTFLQLLITQMKNQDPTQPMDTAQLMSQLASFSQVEQGIKTNSKLDSLLTANALSQADGVIGRTITSADGSKSGVVESVTITSDGAMATLQGGATLMLGAGIKVS